MDTYHTFAQLALYERDFSIDVIDRGSPVTILAPHGGAIEPHTTEIARHIAGSAFNFYSFTGKKAQNNQILHITSHRWDEPQAIRLVSRSETVITVHGCRAKNPIVILGGRDHELLAAIHSELVRHHFIVTAAGRKHTGLNPLNICNRCRSGRGVQLEVSRAIRDEQTRWPDLAAAVRSAVIQSGRSTALAPVR